MNLPGRAVAVICLANLAQLPVAMRQLLVVLLGHHNTGSFAAAGAAGAACGVGLAVSSPVAGRLMARIGHRPVLLATGGAHLAALLGLALTRDPVAFAVLAAAAGLATPPVLSSGRALLPVLVADAGAGGRRSDERAGFPGRPGSGAGAASAPGEPGAGAAGGAPPLTRAYGINAIGQELLYIGGPLAVTLSLAVSGPGGALLAFAAVGSAALAAHVAVIPRRPGPVGDGTARAGDGRRDPAAARTLIGAHIGYMTCMGAMWVLLPAFATATGRPGAAGVLVTVWSAGSLAGGVLRAATNRRASGHRTYLALLAGLAVTAAALPLPGTVPQMAVAVALFGLPLAPWLAVTDELMARAVPPPHTAEAYGWLQTAGQLGIALGAAAGGQLSDHSGTAAGFLLVPGALAAALAFAASRRHTLRPPAEALAAPAGTR
jgi:predicted MFS family arabinose efflux permease